MEFEKLEENSIVIDEKESPVLRVIKPAEGLS
jgi:hypothetical protein